jgi:hypothetical protein
MYVTPFSAHARLMRISILRIPFISNVSSARKCHDEVNIRHARIIDSSATLQRPHQPGVHEPPKDMRLRSVDSKAPCVRVRVQLGAYIGCEAVVTASEPSRDYHMCSGRFADLEYLFVSVVFHKFLGDDYALTPAKTINRSSHPIPCRSVCV